MSNNLGTWPVHVCTGKLLYIVNVQGNTHENRY